MLRRQEGLDPPAGFLANLHGLFPDLGPLLLIGCEFLHFRNELLRLLLMLDVYLRKLLLLIRGLKASLSAIGLDRRSRCSWTRFAFLASGATGQA